VSLLAGVNYDPGSAASVSTASAIAMTAIDTTNLRLTFTAPSNGTVMVRMRCCDHGAGSSPMILLGVLDGSTVKGRISPWSSTPGGASGTERQVHDAQFLVTGLTPGNSYTWDAAYAVQVVVASTNIKYGGPNDASNNNAYGAFHFSIWETQNLLAGMLYDPATDAEIDLGTGTLSAMAAIDSTNLRLSFTAPSSGRVLVRMHVASTGATGTRPVTLLGVLDGATVKGRMGSGCSKQRGTGLASDHYILNAGFHVSGLTPGNSYTWDAAYGQENVLAGFFMAYGGADDAAGNDAWGGFAYEIWSA